MVKKKNVKPLDYCFCTECGMDTMHIINDRVVPDGIKCTVCGKSFIDEVVVFDEKNWDK